VLDWKPIGFGAGLRDPMQDFTSKRRQDQFNKEINRLAADYIARTLCPNWRIFCGRKTSGNRQPSIQLIRIPSTSGILRHSRKPISAQEVRLEIGPLASWVPSARHVIRPYAFDVLPEVFENPDCEVVAIAAERTFREKVTILHQGAHRTTQIPQRYSRHYYDLYKRAVSRVRASALADTKLLQDVVAFKQRFYPSVWADTISPFPAR
jgi:hypothetical protein